MKHEVTYDDNNVPHKTITLEVSDVGITSVVVNLPSGKEVMIDFLPTGGTDSPDPTVIVQAGGGFAVYEERLQDGVWRITWPKHRAGEKV